MLPAIRLAMLCGVALSLSLRAAAGQAQNRVDYTLRIDSAGRPDIDVEMRVHAAPAVFRVAMSAHPEYDDQYWRYLSDLRGESARGLVTATREDSAVWRITAPPGEVTIRYSVHFPSSPPMQQPSWKGHLTATGGLVGGPHSFLYVVGAESAPVRLAVALPARWRIATGLHKTSTPHTFLAPNAEALIDSPLMVGLFRDWRFNVDGVPHDIAFLGAPGGTAFDTALFVSNVERIARETARLFGRMPYAAYQFLFEDGAFGGLEHLNSVSIGTQSANLARDPNSYLGQIAHEFFHTWNEVHVRPVAWIGLRHEPPAPTGELWFSEGVTLYFADLVLRRAGLHTPDSTRQAHLERMISIYMANPSHAMVSLEQTSRAFNLQEATGDYTPSMYTQGELVGAMLDLMIRDGSRGRQSLDNVVRALATQFTPARGFTGADVERAIARACACDAHPFFETYVRNAAALEFDRWLAVIGLRTVITSTPARSTDGTPVPDTRVSAYLLAGEAHPRLQIWFPSTVWGRAGLHTGDVLMSWNSNAINDVSNLRIAIGQLRVGDTVRVAVMRNHENFVTTVTIAGFERPTVRLEERSDATDARRRLRARWMSGK